VWAAQLHRGSGHILTWFPADVPRTQYTLLGQMGKKKAPEQSWVSVSQCPHRAEGMVRGGSPKVTRAGRYSWPAYRVLFGYKNPTAKKKLENCWPNTSQILYLKLCLLCISIYVQLLPSVYYDVHSEIQ
jgi:hypothetical protein